MSIIRYIPTIDRELVDSTTLGGSNVVSLWVLNKRGLPFWLSPLTGGCRDRCRGMDTDTAVATMERSVGARTEGVRSISSTEGCVNPIILQYRQSTEESSLSVKLVINDTHEV